MMIRTAGGPHGVSPLDFNERRKPGLSQTSWMVIGVVALAHIGVGVALYNQRFELALETKPETPPTVIFLEDLPRPKPIEPPKPEPKPAAPNPVVNKTPLPNQPTETITVPVSDPKPTTGTTMTFNEPVVDPVPDQPPALQPQPDPPAVISRPNWIRQPTGEQLARVFPDRALQRGVAGTASLNCLVEVSGRVTDCRITGETPGGYGFGRAAQSVSRYFQISPQTVNGAAQGSRVAINMRFNLPQD
jgi:periplasmic protein TonB